MSDPYQQWCPHGCYSLSSCAIAGEQRVWRVLFFCCFALILLFMGLQTWTAENVCQRETSLVHGWMLSSEVVRPPAPPLVAAVAGANIQWRPSFFQGHSVIIVVVRLWIAFVKSGSLLPFAHCWYSVSCHTSPNTYANPSSCNCVPLAGSHLSSKTSDYIRNNIRASACILPGCAEPLAKPSAWPQLPTCRNQGKWSLSPKRGERRSQKPLRARSQGRCTAALWSSAWKWAFS